MSSKELTREEWLKRCGKLLVKLLKSKGYDCSPDWRVSVGFPRTRGGRNNAIGQCWSKIVSTDKHTEIFISPTLDDAARVADVLAHELCHHVVGIPEGHNAKFRDCAYAIGLTGPATATVAGIEFTEWFKQQKLPAYPHARMAPPADVPEGAPIPKLGGPMPGWITPKAGTSGVMVKFSCSCGVKWKMSKRDAQLVSCCPACKAKVEAQ